MARNKKTITAGELALAVSDDVRRQANRLYGREQVPVIRGESGLVMLGM